MRIGWLRSTMSVFVGVLLAGVLATVVGCHRGSGAQKNPTQEYPIRGIIVTVDPSGQSVLLKHEAVAGFMEAMTMSYKLEDPSVASELHPGDKITATLAVDHDSIGPTNLRLRNIVVIAQARPDYKPTVQYHTPTPGESVPDFKLLNQSAHTISLKQFQGKVLVVTFIYTRCPLADYCPRMSHNFAEIDKQLAAEPALYAKTHLLSVSFDPTYDTPKVLRSYGEAYTGRYTKETFDHWDFAAPSQDNLNKMEQYFSVGVTPGDNGSLQHSLSTVVFGKDGKVVAFYPTNDWAVDAVMKDIRGAAA